MKEKLKQTCLKQKEPFLYDWINHTKTIENKNIPTIGITPNKELMINPKFIKTLTQKETIGILYHEALHLYYNHHKTKKTNHYLVNTAGDIYINEELINCNYTLPKNCLRKKTYKIPNHVETAEEIYLWLEKNLSKQQKISLYEINKKELKRLGKKLENDKDHDLKTKILIKNIKKSLDAKAQNNQIIQESTPIPWDIDLTGEIGRLIKRIVQKNYRRPARYEPENIIRPCMKKTKKIPKINLYIDKSGSMQNTLGVVISSVKNVKNKLKDYIPTYYFFDTDIIEVCENDLDNVCASGGTVFNSVSGCADLHVIITDGELDFGWIDSRSDIVAYVIRDGVISRRIK